MNKTKRTIQVIGKICRIISMILLVLNAIGAGFMIIFGIVLTVMPTNTAEIDIKGSTEIEISGKIIEKIPDGTIKSFISEFNEGLSGFTFNGQSLSEVGQGENSVIFRNNGSYVYLNLRKLGIVCIINALITATLIYVLLMLGRFMKKLEESGSPFEDGAVKAMTQFAISLLPYAVLKPTLTSLSGAIFATGNVSVKFSIDTTTVFAALIVILMVLIFRYGAQLQKNEDETL